jgi:hypothetical protein
MREFQQCFSLQVNETVKRTLNRGSSRSALLAVECCAKVASLFTHILLLQFFMYRAIEDEDWEHVHHFLLHGYWPGKLFYDPTSAADQARTWVTRYHYPPGGGSNGSKNGGSSDQPVVLWSQLPLHLCCILNAPYDIVSRLLECTFCFFSILRDWSKKNYSCSAMLEQNRFSRLFILPFFFCDF